MIMKKCKKCSQEKKIGDFRTPRGTVCVACQARRDREYHKKYKRAPRPYDANANRNSSLKRKFDITIEQYDQMFEAQGGKCAICGSLGHTDRAFHVDHSHIDGEVRGLLCFRCNVRLGIIENYEFYKKAVAYLGKAGLYEKLTQDAYDGN